MPFPRTLILLLLLLLLLGGNLPNIQAAPYQNPDLPVEERVEDLLARMTTKEKVAQLQAEYRTDQAANAAALGIGNATGMLKRLNAREAVDLINRIQRAAMEETRLGIPVLVTDEGLHGLWAVGASSFPQSIGMAASWNPGLMAEVADAIGEEAKSRGIGCILSPVVNIARDSRWGRTEETFGEDPFLTACFGAAYCAAVEARGVATSPKHYVANIGDGGRDSNAVHMSERLLREVYLPGFKACVEEGGASTIMAAYNSLDGIPVTVNRWLLTDVLRDEWGFDGAVVTDYASAPWVRARHRVGENKMQVAAMSINAGTDIELPFIDIYGEPLVQALENGLVTEATLDKTVARILRIKFRLGLFDNPYADANEAERVNNSEEHRALAKRAALETFVLLKNKNDTLPLNLNSLRSVALLGPMADIASLGGYSGSGMKTVSPAEGIANALPAQVELTVEPGTRIELKDDSARQRIEGDDGFPPAIALRRLVPTNALPDDYGLRGFYYANKTLTGEPTLERIDSSIDFDWSKGAPAESLPADGFSVRWSGKLIAPGTGEYELAVQSDDGIRVWFDDKLLIDRWVTRGPTTDTVRLNLEKNTSYPIRIEYFEDWGGASIRLGLKDLNATGDPMERAIATAAKADIAIIVTGIIEGEKFDRSNLDLPGRQEELIERVHATGTPIVVVMTGGGAVTMERWIDKVDAVLVAWHPGMEGGNALADVLFGDYNPGGKLPITFPRSTGQLPLYYNHKPTGRGYDYHDLSGTPRFPFGHGLSYTSFQYDNAILDPKIIDPGETATLAFDVSNTGSVPGDEVVQLYVHDQYASVARPVKELKAFQRIRLAPGETRTVEFKIDQGALEMLDIDLNRVVEPGTFELMVGSSSENIRLRETLTINEGLGDQ